jgi:VIT1/CCC1 family predicted Fe2+/Mn2+ transporter
VKTFLSSKPVLLFLFLVNAIVAITAYFVVDGSQGLVTSIGMGVVSLGALVALVGRRTPAPRVDPQR